MAARKSIRERFELHGRNYIVTGGAMGIGYAITRDIAEMGGNVAVLDLRDEPLEDVYGLAQKHGVKTSYFQADVSDEKSLRAGFDSAMKSLGSLDGIVTAAGIAISKPYVDQCVNERVQPFLCPRQLLTVTSFGLRGWEEVNKVIQVNVIAPVHPRNDES